MMPVRERLGRQMTRAQTLKLRKLSREAYQPNQFAVDLDEAEAQRRIKALEDEIALADSF